MGQCQAAVAEAVETFGKLDILLCCSSEGWHLYDFLERKTSRLICYCSPGWLGGRISGLSADTKSNTGTVREQLLRSCQLHQGCITHDAEKEQWTYYGIDGYKSVSVFEL